MVNHFRASPLSNGLLKQRLAELDMDENNLTNVRTILPSRHTFLLLPVGLGDTVELHLHHVGMLR